ncbi:hypothetical protein E8E13_002530 [Curvularia kusanoi]|uniref:Gfd2/YDR514C-like C-terminal domain-containing protein n=1 Tax=Curvularia kusanoi TaxID=90978 RepID=A0A9P4W8V1_CURKU|nr:hypothetical protein E8E13_002530 [Curvularia kusanoi]
MTDPKVSYAQALAATPNISPKEMMSELKKAYSEEDSKEDSMSRSEVLRDALGVSQQPHKNLSDTARKLAEHTVIICVDTESHTLNTDQMTELAIVQIAYARSSKQYQEGVGPHGRRLHKALDFMHFRIAEHAHLKSNRKNSLGPEGNRFGHSRWVTFEELRTILYHLFHRPVQSDDPELKGCLAPIVLVGHALEHDVENARKPGLDFDIAATRTVVATIDTQKLAKEGVNPIWSPPPGSATNEIGLKKLVEALGFEHTDDHTACNDAARTMMCAIIMVLEDKFTTNQSVTMKQVATEVENNSKTRPAMAYACHRFDTGPHRNRSAYSHVETYCDHVAKFKAWLRRYKDATRKFNEGSRKSPPEVKNELEPAAHPWSTWPPDSKLSIHYRPLSLGVSHSSAIDSD